MESPHIMSLENKVLFLSPHLWHIINYLWGLYFLSVGQNLLIKYLSVGWGTVVCDKCQPSTLHSAALAYFTKNPSTKWILNIWSNLFPYVILYIMTSYRTEVFKGLQNSFIRHEEDHKCVVHCHCQILNLIHLPVNILPLHQTTQIIAATSKLHDAYS
jgi:hypothetical protein